MDTKKHYQIYSESPKPKSYNIKWINIQNVINRIHGQEIINKIISNLFTIYRD